MAAAITLTNLTVFFIAVGLTCLSFPRALPLPAWGRFSFGIALGPAVMGSLYLLLLWVFPSIPQSVASLGLLALAALVTAIVLPRTLRGLSFGWGRPDLETVVLAVAVLVLAGLVLQRILFYVGLPLSDVDAMQYLAQARQMVIPDGAPRISGMSGLADGSLRGDLHGPLWVAILAAPHPFTTMDLVSIRLIMTLVFLSGAAAVLAVASALPIRRLAVIFLLLIVSVPFLSYSLNDGGRDVFRLSMLLLLQAVLLSHLSVRRRLSLGEGAVVAFVAMAAVQGHGIAVVIVPVTVAAWAAVGAVMKADRVRVIAVIAASVVGFTVGTLHLTTSYVETGKLTGDNVLSGEFTKGTAYAAADQDVTAARIGAGRDLAGRVMVMVQRDGGWPSVVSAFAFALGLVYLVRRRQDPQAPLIAAIGAWWLVNTLYVLGVFDTSGMELGAWTALNIRYAKQWYMEAALVTATAIALLLQGASRYRHSVLVRGVVLASLVAFGAWQTNFVSTTWKMEDKSLQRDRILALSAAAQSLPEGCVVLSEDPGVYFYFNRKVVQLYSKAYGDLIQAKTAEEIEKIMNKKNICAVIILKGLYVDVAGEKAPLLPYLKGPEFTMQQEGVFQMFIKKAAGTSG